MSAPRRRWWWALGIYSLVFVAAATVGSTAYFHFADPRGTCASCHEMRDVHTQWSESAHRSLHCRNCHGGSLTLDAHAMRSHLNRVVQHFTGDPEKSIRLVEHDLLEVDTACRECHPKTSAEHQSSKHATTYGRIFLPSETREVEQPASDCLRCHGMFFDGDIPDLLAPVNGPKRVLRDPAKADQPAVPCLACHQIHTPSGGTRPPHFYDRREKAHFAATQLPIGPGPGAVVRPRVSLDPRQRVCMQCHAPAAASGHPPGASDERTPRGVHEGLSCLDCHATHTRSARESCRSCHPSSSHCGLNIETMDTTFAVPTSRHDIHFVACGDCHDGRRPAQAAGRRR